MPSLRDTQSTSRSNTNAFRFYNSALANMSGRCFYVLFIRELGNELLKISQDELSASITGTKTSKAALDAIAAGYAKYIKK